MRRVAARLRPLGSLTLSDYVVDCSWSPDDHTVAVGLGNGSIEVLDAAARSSRTVGSHSLGAVALDWFADGSTLCSSGQEGAVRFWPIDASAQQLPTHRARQWTSQVRARPGHNEIATSSGRSIVIWGRQGTPVRSIPEPTASIHTIAWSPDGKVLAAAGASALSLYRFDTPTVAATQMTWPGATLTLAFSPNSRYLAAGMQDGVVRFRRLASQASAQMSGYESKVEQIGWTSSNRFLVTASGAEVIAWDFSGKGPEGREPLRLTGHTERIVALEANPVRPLVASAGRDWRIAVWEPGAHEAPLDVQMTSAEPSVMRWSRNGSMLAVGQTSGELSIYELMSG